MVEFSHKVELFIDGVWTDVTRLDADTRVLGMDGKGAITISRGKASEGADVVPTQVNLTFLDNNATFNTENPLSAYYGKLGRNTPLRVVPHDAAATIIDDFNRTSASGWGTLPGTGGYLNTGNGGSVVGGDFTVSSGTGKHSVPVVNAHRRSWLPVFALTDVETYIECTLVAAPTGDSLEPTLLLKGSGSGSQSYYMLRAVIAVGGAVTVKIISVEPSGETELATAASGVTFATASGALKMRGRINNTLIEFKVWQGGSEPAYQVSATDNVLSSPGWVGVRSGVAAANSNTKPVVFTYDNYTISYKRVLATVEVASWKPKWKRKNGSSYAITVPVTASGITQRLSQGNRPLRSVAYRGITAAINSSHRVAYWPMEEEDGATQVFAYTGPNGIPVNEINFGAYTGQPASERMITIGADGRIDLDIPAYTSTQHRIIALWSPPASPGAGERELYRVYCVGGTVTHFDVYNNGESVGYKAYFYDTLLFSNASSYSGGWSGRNCFMSMELTETAGNVSVALYISNYENVGGQGFTNQTWTSRTIGRLSHITVGNRHLSTIVDSSNHSIGHLAVASTIASFPNFTAFSGNVVGFRGFAGERAGTRLLRLGTEEGITINVDGNPSSTTEMGPQLSKTLVELLKECAAVDMGILFEPRDVLGYRYKIRERLFNQDPRVTLTYAVPTDHLSEPFLPVDDDNGVRNAITATRVGGSSALYVIPDNDTEHLTTQSPPLGVNTYSETINVNTWVDSILNTLAAWYAHIRAWKEQRFPTIKVELARSVYQSDSATSKAVSSMEIGEVFGITTTGAPRWVNRNPLKMLVRGTVEVLGRMQYEITFNATSSYPYEIGKIGYADGTGTGDGTEDLRGAAIDTDLATLNGAHNSSTTSLSVASSDATKVLWTTSSGDWDTTKNGGGLFIIVNGEVMRITAISGASSPQTFTVVRSINNITRSHLTGSKVHTYTPTRISY